MCPKGLSLGMKDRCVASLKKANQWAENLIHGRLHELIQPGRQSCTDYGIDQRNRKGNCSEDGGAGRYMCTNNHGQPIEIDQDEGVELTWQASSPSK